MPDKTDNNNVQDERREYLHCLKLLKIRQRLIEIMILSLRKI